MLKAYRGRLKRPNKPPPVQFCSSLTQAPGIENPGQPSAGHEHIARNQIAMVHYITGRAARQGAHGFPYPAQPRDIEQLAAARKAGLHQLVVRAQVTSATLSAERPAAGAERAHAAYELGQVAANAADPPGSSSTAVVPGSQVCTAHGSG